MTTHGPRHTRARTPPGVQQANGEILPRESVERPHPVTGKTVAFHYRDVVSDGVWTAVCDGRVLGVLVQPYSVLEDPPTVYVALPPHVTSLMAGLYSRSWDEALAYLERNAE